MGNALTIFKRELKANFTSPLAYVFLVVFLVFINWWFWYFSEFFAIKQADARSLFGVMPMVFMFFIPAITMRLWAEEKKQGTIEFLLTMPLRDIEVVAGKFAACLLFLFIALALTLGVPVAVHGLAEADVGIDWGPIFGGYAGVLLMGASYIAIGLFASSITSNQIISYIVGVVLCFGLFVVGHPTVTARAPEFLAPVLSQMGLGAHFARLSQGLVDSRDIVYYASVIVFFLYLNIRVLDSRSYR